MLKLSIISGPNVGTSYSLQDGETSIGRQTGNVIVLPSSKISKKHCVITVSGSEISLQDVGSSNGTFVNGVLTKNKKLKTGDRVSVGEYVFEVTEPRKPAHPVHPVHPVQRTPSNTQAFRSSAPALNPMAGMSGMTGMTGMGSIGIAAAYQMPKDFKGKVAWIFENHLMPVIYGLNIKNEWKFICVGIFTAFVVINLIVTVHPLMESNREQVIQEIGRRASFMARQIADYNTPFLASHAETKTDIGLAENAEGVRVAVLIDLDNRILAPASKLNQYLTSGVEAIEATKARDLFRSGRETGFRKEVDSSTLLAFEPVKILNPAVGKNVIVAMAVISIDTDLATPDLGAIGIVYSESLILSGILGAILLLILYRMTLKPFEVLNEDLDKALKGEITLVTREFKFPEMNPLWDLINSAIQRIPKADSTSGSGLGGLGNDAQNMEDCIYPMRMLGGMAKLGLVVFDSEQKILYLNSLFEEMSGIREDSSVGRQMSDVARDQSMGAFTNDLLARASNGSEGVSEDFDFSGVSYKMYAAAFGTPGNSPKGYILAAIKAEA